MTYTFPIQKEKFIQNIYTEVAKLSLIILRHPIDFHRNVSHFYDLLNIETEIQSKEKLRSIARRYE